MATVVALLVSLGACPAVDIVGTITLKGTPPPETTITFPAGDTACGKLHTAPLKTRFYVVGPNGGLADTFVHIVSGLKSKPPPPDKSVLLDQVGCEYMPYVVGLQTGQKLLIRNSDPFLHNVHATPSKDSGNEGFNQAQLPGGKELVKTIDHPEVFLRVKCDVHNWMFAYIGVVDHPYFAVSGKDGAYRVPNVPPGTYTVEAYHRKAGKVVRELTVGHETVTLDFAFELKPP
jgi:hypothetical protein